MTTDGLSPTSETLFDNVRPYRGRIGLTYCLTLAENVFGLLYPFAIGLAINELIAGEGWSSLVPFAGVWLAHIVTGALRQYYDTRLFSRIYGEVAGGMIVRQRTAGVTTGEVTARSTMAREAVDFFEIEIPTVITVAISLFGGIGMLFYYQFIAGLIMAVLLVPVAGLQFVYGRRMHAFNVRLNDRREREVDVIEDGRRGRVRAHFRALAKWRIMISDAQVRVWSSVELMSLVAVMIVTLQLTAEPGIQAGDVFALLSYVFSVLAAFDQAPIIVEQIARLIDIRRRVDTSKV